MNTAFDEILRADTETRGGLFAATAQRLGSINLPVAMIPAFAVWYIGKGKVSP